MTYRVSVEGQINAPFQTIEGANEYAESMRKEGFDCIITKEQADD